MDLLEQCELDDEKLLGKSSRQRGPKVGENEGEVKGDTETQREEVKMKATSPKGPQKNVKNGIRETEKEGGRGQAGSLRPQKAHRTC